MELELNTRFKIKKKLEISYNKDKNLKDKFIEQTLKVNILVNILLMRQT